MRSTPSDNRSAKILREERLRIASRFDSAAAYDTAASVQRTTARRLAARLRSAFAGRAPGRVLEFGCGSGFLTGLLRDMWPDAQIVATDISPAMVERARARCPMADFATMDAAQPELPDGLSGLFDLVCGNLALQWIEPRDEALAGLARMLRPGGVLAATTLADGSFVEWRAAHAAQGFACGMREYPADVALQHGWPHRAAAPWRLPEASGRWEVETLVEQTGGGLAFMRGLRAIGATEAAPDSVSLSPGAMRRVVARFDAAGGEVTWRVAYGLFRTPPRAGVFVTGTDTGIGKTFVSACLTHAWDALYWKPLQTGLAEEDGDAATIVSLGAATPDRIVPGAEGFLAPLSPEDAAAAEDRRVNLDLLVTPMAQPDRPLVVEGAGGVLVPLTAPSPETGEAGAMILDLIERMGLPVVLVARSGLGTINHTLLSIEAMRARGVAIAGVVMNGPLSPGNRAAIERHGHVAVLAEIPPFEQPTPDAVAEASRLLPLWPVK